MVLDADYIGHGIYLGSSAYTQKELEEKNINVIVNITPESEIARKTTLEFHRYPVSFILTDEQNAKNIRDAINHIYRMVKDYGKYIIYLHCFEGVNRSAVVAIGVIAKLLRCSVEDAISYVSKRRKIMPQEKYLRFLS